MRNRFRKGPLAILFGFLALALLPVSAGAQTGTAAADTVVSVTVRGNSSVDGELIKRGFGLPVGSRYSADSVRRGIRRLYDLGFFNDVSVEGDLVPGGLALTVVVVENPRVGQVEYAGLDHFNEKKVVEVTGPLIGKLADERLLARVKRRLVEAYSGDGYTRAEVSARYLPGDSEARRILYLEVTEGPKMRVEAIEFTGLQDVDPGELRGAMDQGTTGFLKKGIYKPAVLRADMERIELRLANLGHRDGTVTGFELLPGSKDDRYRVSIAVDEGPLYTFGDVRWEGNDVMATPILYAVTKVRPGARFSQEQIEQSIQEVYGLYADQGYIRVTVLPDFAVTDTTVDLTLQVIEGEPSHVNDIIIQGNTRTKERVIRRQLAIRPGDLFRRNALIRSQRELFQLGYFSDMQFDPRPVADSDDFDLVVNVEERQVGTASAGFGFSSSVGLTGFIELGHSNLFGNGQSLNLRLERGSQRNQAELSFTEPWFRGTPTTLGFDLFSTNRIYRSETVDLEIQRAGGAVRVGRQLPIPYTRAFATYRLESQRTIDETVDRSRQVVTGFRINEDDRIISSLALSLTRNSTDHYLYPTTGSNTILRMDFSGGLIGGDQTYQKYELDIKKYLPTFRAGGWNPILMVRPRLGASSDLFRDNEFVSDYRTDPVIPDGSLSPVRFGRLGRGGSAYQIAVPTPRHYREFVAETNEFFRMGGTTFNALRGYDDYEIVPRENVTQRYINSQTTWLGTDGYVIDPGKVYYPGGRYMLAFTLELQFPIADPLHGLVFTEAGGTWNHPSDFRWDDMHRSMGMGLRIEIPLLGLVGFDYAYGFDRLDRSLGVYNLGGWEPHIQFGRVF